jgi:Ca2+-binding RTX toxin-like protein
MEAQVANINNWSIESRSPDVANLRMVAPPDPLPAGMSTRNRIALDATLGKDEAPIALKVTPDASAQTGDLTFLLDPTIINDTGFGVFAGDLSLIDGPTVPATSPTHTPFAHFHDASVFLNWENPTVGSFETLFASNNTTGTFQNINGANEIRLSGGSAGGIDAGAQSSLTGFGIHQFLNEPGPAGNSVDGSPSGNGGSFYIVLSTGGAGQNGQFDQVLEGDGGNNTLTGDASHAGSPLPRNDLIFGYDGDDTMNGGLGNDTLVGGNGDDELDGGVGNNHLLGGEGWDTAVFDGARASFIVSTSLFSDFTISNGSDLFDSVTDVENFKFSDVTLSKADLLAGHLVAGGSESPPTDGLSGSLGENQPPSGAPSGMVGDSNMPRMSEFLPST